ncbi:MAG TPA: recombinase RecT, partial [Holophaga sp.]|nr:recombinase RecT [Holophaga sp.]
MAAATPAPTGAVNTAKPFNPNKPAASLGEVRRFLEANAGAIRKVAVASMSPDRMVAIMAQAVSRNPLLAKCTPMSMLNCLKQGAELGLEVAGQLQEFHPIPYWNSDLGAYEAQGVPGYPGLVKLVLQSKEVGRVEARVVYKGDTFDYELGDTPFLRHKPSLDHLGEDRPDEDIAAFYAIAFYHDGSKTFEVMGKGAIDKLKDRALAKKKNKDAGPWATDYAQMGRKSVLRRLCKVLPKSPALAKALALQEAAEAGDFTGRVLDT